jgi:hypothetical protein
MLVASQDVSKCDAMEKDLGLCTRPSNATDWAQVQSQVQDQLATIPQFDYATPGLYPPNSLAVLTNQTLQASSGGAILRNALLLNKWSTANASTCYPWAGADPYSSIAQFGIGNAFLYINCRYFILSETPVAPDNTLFTPSAPDFDPAAGACPFAGAAWVSSDLGRGAAFWEAKLGITDAELDKVTRLVITHGSFDRTTAIGTPNLSRTTSNREQSRVITVAGMGHGENAMSERLLKRGVRPQVDQLRDTQLAYIQEWLGLGAGNGTYGSGPGSM